MASFEIFCEPHMGCIKKAVAEVSAIIPERYDWRDTNPSYTLTDTHIILAGASHMQLDQMLRELCYALRRQLVSLAFIGVGRPEQKGERWQVSLKIERGITKPWAEHLIKMMKRFCIPARYTYQNEQIKVVTGHIDDAQQIIAQMRIQKIDIPIHYRNLTDDTEK